ncbi:hypothetical protein ACHHYP_09385 [Achlya hypogyna]|uniref:Secreted protein n=2 Tax=Achlya hypogyna TaxID=1202772 RepID=A0A1V9ZJ27_ACHHY|nr:hypothetical protein ACHHYP_09385 [Achlya hypogyna]
MRLTNFIAFLVPLVAAQDAPNPSEALRLVDSNIAQLIADMQAIAENGMNDTLRASIKSNLEQANAAALHSFNGSDAMLLKVDRVTRKSKLEAFDPTTGIDIVNGVQDAVTNVLSLLDPNPKVCMRRAVGRGVGYTLSNQCLAGEEAWGALCYPKCQEGYENVGCCICRKKGCGGVKGVTDIGVSCTKPAAYGRGSGYALWNQDKCNRENAQGCEKNLLMWYPKCQPGYHNFGCCICTPNCPAGSHDDGAFCRKDHYGRGVGKSRLGCDAGLEQSGLLCYPKCDEGYHGVGPLCWPKCSGETPFRCGLFCASSSATCASSTIEIVGSAAKMALSIAGQDVVGAISSAVQVGKKLIFMDKCPAPTPFVPSISPATPTLTTVAPTPTPTATSTPTTTTAPTKIVATTIVPETTAPTTGVVEPTTVPETTTPPTTAAPTDDGSSVYAY